MKKDATIQELAEERSRILRSMILFHLAAEVEATDVLRRIDPEYATSLFGGADLPWGDEGLYPDTARFLAEIRRAEAVQRMCLLSDIEVLRKVKDTKADQVHRGPFGLREALFPVVLQGRVVHVVWSGKVRDEAFSAAEIADLSKTAGLSQAKAEELARSVPVVGRKPFDRVLVVCSRFRDALQQALSEHVRAADLAQQLVQSERAHSVGVLSGGVAHHFNNLLSVILGYSSFVANREKLSKEAADALHKITDAAQRGRRLTEEILAFLGSEAEEDAPCRVHDTVRSVLSLLESKTGTKVKVDSKLNAARDVVLATPSSIRQIIFNLLTNAIDSMPAGGTIEIRTRNTQMATEGGQQEYFQLEVIDSGGLSDAARRGAAGGDAGGRIGMKLSSVYGMVGRLDGTVLISAEAGAATRVQVLLPVLVEGAAVREEKKIRKRLAPSLIWVVDDDAIFREMCRQVLTDEGHTVMEASGGREFQEMWRKGGEKPDLIIMDFSMPEYNGLQLCEWLRNEGARVPVVLVSGFASNQPDIRKALRLRKTYFLQKPFSFREMADTVTVALGETLIGE